MKLNMTDSEMILAYTVEELSTTEIARLTGLSASFIGRRLNELGVQMRGKSTLTPRQASHNVARSLAAYHASRETFEPKEGEFLSRIWAAGGYQNAHISERQRCAA